MKAGGEKKATGGPSKEILDEAVRRILSVVKPRRIILFGSAARGEAGPESDIDLLVEFDLDRSLFDHVALIHDLEDLLAAKSM